MTSHKLNDGTFPPVSPTATDGRPARPTLAVSHPSAPAPADAGRAPSYDLAAAHRDFAWSLAVLWLATALVLLVLYVAVFGTCQ